MKQMNKRKKIETESQIEQVVPTGDGVGGGEWNRGEGWKVVHFQLWNKWNGGEMYSVGNMVNNNIISYMVTDGF